MADAEIAPLFPHHRSDDSPIYGFFRFTRFYDSFVLLEYVVWPFQMIGILLVAFIALLFLVGVFTPVLYDCFVPPKKELEANESSKQEQAQAVQTESVEGTIDEELNAWVGS